MIDAILVTFFVGVFYASFKAGNKFKSLTISVKAGLNKL